MRIGDWSSDVCSSDLMAGDGAEDGANRNQPVVSLLDIATLPGSHNWQNAAAAYAAAKAAGLDRQAILDGLRSYPGLAHRQQLAAVTDGVRYVNDSKATNADAAARALACYDRSEERRVGRECDSTVG